eukprot:COSAG01_NODE_10818_length_2074_cov_1.678987_2_plen_122_part_00
MRASGFKVLLVVLFEYHGSIIVAITIQTSDKTFRLLCCNSILSMAIHTCCCDAAAQHRDDIAAVCMATSQPACECAMRPTTSSYQALDLKTFISNKFETPENRPYNGRNGYVHEYVTIVFA